MIFVDLPHELFPFITPYLNGNLVQAVSALLPNGPGYAESGYCDQVRADHNWVEGHATVRVKGQMSWDFKDNAPDWLRARYA